MAYDKNHAQDRDTKWVYQRMWKDSGSFNEYGKEDGTLRRQIELGVNAGSDIRRHNQRVHAPRRGGQEHCG